MNRMRTIQIHSLLRPSLQILALLGLLLGLLLPASPNANAQPTGAGTVVAWGQNDRGQTDVPAGLTNVIAVAAGRDHSLALKSDGTVVGWGANGDGQTNVPTGLTDVIAVAAQGYLEPARSFQEHGHSLALKRDGTVVGWGNNNLGQLSIPAGLNNVVAIAAGEMYTLALKGDGTVVGWGAGPAVPAGVNNMTAIAAGARHSLALKSDGTVVAWGDNSYAQLNLPAGLNNVTAIAAGGFHNLALKNDGTVVAWGYNGDGQSSVPAGLDDVVAIAAGSFYSLALRSDGTVVGWGAYAATPAGLSNVTAIAAGEYHSLAIRPANIKLTANIVDVTPNTRNSSVSNIAITFSAPVTGFDKQDLGLSWNGIPLDLASVVLSGSGSSYTLSGLDSLTTPVGAYALTLVASGSGIQDAQGHSLAGDAADTWTMDTETGAS